MTKPDDSEQQKMLEKAEGDGREGNEEGASNGEEAGKGVGEKKTSEKQEFASSDEKTTAETKLMLREADNNPDFIMGGTLKEISYNFSHLFHYVQDKLPFHLFLYVLGETLKMGKVNEIKINENDTGLKSIIFCLNITTFRETQSAPSGEKITV